MFAQDPFARRVFWARPRLGQQDILPEMIAPRTPNRLDEVPVNVILSRRQLLLVADEASNMPADISAALNVVPEEPAIRVGQKKEEEPSKLGTWSADDYTAIAAVYREPTEDELRDLSLIDGFFAKREKRQSNQKTDLSYTGLIRGIACGTARSQATGPFSVMSRHNIPAWMEPRGMSREVSSPFVGNPFFCGPAQDIPLPMSFFWYWDNIPAYFGINEALPWEEVKGTVLRAIAVLDALKDYPFPSPISVMPQLWYHSIQSNMKEFVHQDIIVNRTLARFWITIAVLQVYEDVSAWIISRLKRKAKRQKRMAIIKAIGMAAVFAIMAAGLGAAFATLIPAGSIVTAGQAAQAVTSAIQYAISYENRKRAAEDLEKAAKQFEKDDPAFAEEAHKAAETMDYMAAQTQRLAELTQEEAEAIAEGDVEQEVTPEEIGGPLLDVPPEEPGASPLVGGGVAAAGIVALAFAIFS